MFFIEIQRNKLGAKKIVEILRKSGNRFFFIFAIYFWSINLFVKKICGLDSMVFFFVVKESIGLQ